MQGFALLFLGGILFVFGLLLIGNYDFYLLVSGKSRNGRQLKPIPPIWSKENWTQYFVGAAITLYELSVGVRIRKRSYSAC
jgi:hypothetical protein